MQGYRDWSNRFSNNKACRGRFSIVDSHGFESILRGAMEVECRTSIRYSDRSVKNKDDRDDPTKLRADVLRGSNDVNHRRLSRALAARSTSEAVGPERRQRPSSDLRRSPAPAKDRPSRATRLLASESTPRGDSLALQPVHRSRWTACRRGSAAPPTMVLEENVRVSGVSLPALLGGKGVWRSSVAQ